MKAEIIAVGTELLLGQIVNTNAQYISEGLARLGVNVYFQTVVGDNENRIMEALRRAASRADLVICTGGLGPTQDDITKDVLARYLDVELRYDEQTLSRIKAYYLERNLEMPASNARQASLPVGADPLPNDNGMAVGAAYSKDGKHFILLPGPPREMKLMFNQYACAWIRNQLDETRPLFSRMLRFAGIGESSLEKLLLDLIEEQRDVTIASYAKEGEVHIRLTVRAASEEEASVHMEPILEQIRSRTSDYLYTEDDQSLEEVLVGMMSERGLTLSTAESISGGLLAEHITSVAGSSRVFRGGMITYSPESKRSWLQVQESTLTSEGTISATCASEMATNVRKLSGSDFGLALTGVAGPDSSEGKPVGLVFLALAHAEGVEVKELRLGSDRQGNRFRAVRQACYQLWLWLKQNSKADA